MIRRSLAVFAPAVLLVGLLATGAATAQDYQRNYTIPPHGSIRVSSISGDVRIIGHSSNSIAVAGYKEGPDRELVQIEDNSDSNHIDLRVRYPESRHCNASVSFEVRVPQGVEYNFERLGAVSGNVHVDNVTGRLRAESVSGDVNIRNVNGIVSASAVSGNVDVQINNLQGSGDMKFSSVSGSVNVKAPATMDADIEMSSISGSLKTNFPIEVQEQRYGPGRSARGRIGSGMHSLRITTVSGRVSLMHP
ncbi:MAG TPA: DUF4097 family beta strand repeat-containing protein [Acidobacteriota bacterium]|nr:DUF4097 family beta strand repeat-containing protein [Acidobacteriota bacterium]